MVQKTLSRYGSGHMSESATRSFVRSEMAAIRTQASESETRLRAEVLSLRTELAYREFRASMRRLYFAYFAVLFVLFVGVVAAAKL